MSNVEYSISDKGCACVISGHAGAGNIGEDVVCSAVTMLMRLFVNCKGYREISEDGYYFIEAEGSPHNKLVFKVICSGFDMMAEQDTENKYIKVIRKVSLT